MLLETQSRFVMDSLKGVRINGKVIMTGRESKVPPSPFRMKHLPSPQQAGPIILHRDGFKIRQVDGLKLRDSDPRSLEFGLIGSHADFPEFIPEDEIWISRRTTLGELEPLITGVIAQMTAIREGVSYDDAAAYSYVAEENVRSPRGNEELHEVKLCKYCKLSKLSNGQELTVFLVDGDRVRDSFRIEFIEGGNDRAYPFVPEGEIWIEAGLSPKEMPAIILHEYVERQLMKEREWTYEQAHDAANIVEYKRRQGNFTKDDLLNVGPEIWDEIPQNPPNTKAESDDGEWIPPHGVKSLPIEELLEVPDIRQSKTGCGAAAAMAVGKRYDVGPDTLKQWEKELGTDESGTFPKAIEGYLSSLGLQVEARDNLTLDDLLAYWKRGFCVIVVCQDYSSERAKKNEQGGHYLTYIGGPWSNYLYFQDSLEDAVVKGSDTDAAPGKVMIEVDKFLELWHDKDSNGHEYVHFGIAVGPPTSSFLPQLGTKSLDPMIADLLKVCHSFSDIQDRGPDYQRLFYNPQTKEVWWESFDGDEESAVREIMRRLEEVAGKGKVRAESESSPKGDDWLLIWPEQKSIGKYGEKKLGKHKFGCLMLPIPADLRKELVDWTMENVLPCHLSETGLEFQSHCTILYGFKDNLPETVANLRSMLTRHGPVSITLKDVSLFTGGKDGDVLKVGIESPELHELHENIKESFDVEDKFPEYLPHLTLAYLLPEYSESVLKYAQPFPFKDKVITIDEAEWSGSDGNREMIPLSYLSTFGIKSSHQGEPCKQGWTEKNTGCVPNNEHGSPQTEPVAPKVEGTADKATVTKSEAFKSWFGDWENDPANASKVVDDDGEPKENYELKKVYHGSQISFDEFDPKKIGSNGLVAGDGFYFAEDHRIADNYKGSKGVMIEAYLCIKNPFDFDALFSEESIKSMVDKAMVSYGQADKREYSKEILDAANGQLARANFSYDEERELFTGYEVWKAFSTVFKNDRINSKVFSSLGYDGLTHLSNDEMGTPRFRNSQENYGRVWIAFKPNQIKSVNNQGTFDPNSNNINKNLPDYEIKSNPTPPTAAPRHQKGEKWEASPGRWMTINQDGRAVPTTAPGANNQQNQQQPKAQEQETQVNAQKETQVEGEQQVTEEDVNDPKWIEKEWSDIVSKHIDEIEENNVQNHEFSVQEIAAEQNWHRDYIKWRWGVDFVKEGAGSNAGKFKPLQVNEIPVASRFISGLLNSAMGGAKYVQSLFSRNKIPQVENEAVLKYVGELNEINPSGAEDLNLPVAQLADALYGKQAEAVVSALGGKKTTAVQNPTAETPSPENATQVTPPTTGTSPVAEPVESKPGALPALTEEQRRAAGGPVSAKDQANEAKEELNGIREQIQKAGSFGKLPPEAKQRYYELNDIIFNAAQKEGVTEEQKQAASAPSRPNRIIKNGIANSAQESVKLAKQRVKAKIKREGKFTPEQKADKDAEKKAKQEAKKVKQEERSKKFWEREAKKKLNELKKKHSGKSLSFHQGKSASHQGEPCKQGWTESTTGCVPATKVVRKTQVRNPTMSPETDEEIAEVRNIVEEHVEWAKQLVQSGSSEWMKPETKERFTEALTSCINNMSVPMMKQIKEAVKEAIFYSSTKDITGRWSALTGRPMQSNKQVGGMWVQEDIRDSQGTLYLDGGYDNTSPEYGDTTRNIYAHELGHALDVGHKLSNSQDWQDAWRDEIDLEHSPLSAYARKNNVEGFAEFFRLVNTQSKAARTEFPKCWAFLQNRGLI